MRKEIERDKKNPGEVRDRGNPLTKNRNVAFILELPEKESVAFILDGRKYNASIAYWLMLSTTISFWNLGMTYHIMFVDDCTVSYENVKF